MAAWKISNGRRLRDLEDENRKLKRLVADLSLDKLAFEDVLKKDGYSKKPQSVEMFLGPAPQRSA